MHGLQSKYIPALDGLRGSAIILVIAHHQLIPVTLKGGFLGVDLFFVLSGFLITSLLQAEFAETKAISLRNFYLRRVLRLGPALAIYLLACLVVNYYTQAQVFGRELRLLLFAICYSTNWRLALGWDPALDPTAIIWSLSIEEQFYLLWPILFSACLMVKLKRSSIALGLGLAILSIMVHRYLLFQQGAELTRLYYATDTRADVLLTGCLIALMPGRELFGKTRNKLRLWLNFALGLATVCFLYLVVVANFTDPFLYHGGYTAIALLSGVLTWHAANSPTALFRWVLEFYPLRWMGKISYGLYLWHWLLLQSTTFYWLVGSWDSWARCVVAIGVAALSFYLIERPFNNLKARYSRAESHRKLGTIHRLRRLHRLKIQQVN